MNFDNIKIIISEIDGVITDGTNATDYMNNTIFKSYYSIDFEVINKLKRYFKFVFLSSDPSVSYNVMRQKNIPTYFSNKEQSKFDTLTRVIITKYRMSPENILYIGSKLSDVKCMNYAEISATTINSQSVLKSTADIVLSSASGTGVIGDLYDFLSPEIDKRKRAT